MNFAQYLPTSLQGLMPDGTGSDPNQMPQDDTMMQLELKRKFALADALKNQAMPQGQMVGDRYVAPSWTQYLANAVGKYQGGQAENQAIKQYGDYTKGKTAKLGALLSDLQQGKEVQAPVDYNEAGNQPGITQATRQPYNDQEYMARVGAAMPELMPKMLESALTNRFKEEAPMTVPLGGTVINKKGDILYQSPPKEESTFAKIDPSKYTPESLTKYGQTKNPSDLVVSKPVAAPVERKRTKGLTEVQEVMIAPPSAQFPEGQWKEVGRGPRFAPEKPQPDPWHFNDKQPAPLTNSKGWALHTDKNGNSAYVSPDGKSFEEAK